MSRKRHKKSQLIAILLLIASTAMGQINQDEWQKTINKGKLEYATENFVTASEYFEEAAKLIPTDTLAHVFLLDCGLRLRKPEIVEKAFKRLQTIGNSQPEYFAKLASVQRTVSHNFPSALATLQDGKKLFPTDKGLAYEELLWYFTKPDLKRLKPLLETFLQKFPGELEPNKMMLKLFIESNELEKASRLVEDLLIAYPDNYEIRKQQADLLLRNKKTADAEPLIRKLLDQNPNDAINHYNMALIHFEKGDYKASAETCKEAIRLDSNFVAAYYNVGTFYLYEGLSYNLALNDMTVAQYRDQGAEFEFNAKRSFDEAMPYLQKAAVLNPDDLDAFENLNTNTALLQTLNTNLEAKAKSKLIADEYADNKDMVSKVQILVDSTGIEMCASGEDCGIPAIRINNLRIEYPDSLHRLTKGKAAVLKFTVQNISNRDAYDLDLSIIQTVTIPDLKHDASLKIDTLKSLQSVPMEIPLQFNPQDNLAPAMKRFPDVENKLRMFVDNPQGLSSSIVEFSVNLGYKIQEIKKAQTQDLEGFEEEVEPRNFLLVIGINKYQKWPQLENAVSDAQTVRDELLKNYRFNNENVYEVYDEFATLKGIRNMLLRIRKDITKDDNLVIYYAGHGIYDEKQQQGAWVPVDADPEKSSDNFINEQLLQFLSKIDVRHTFVIADACFSGSLFVEDSQVSFQPNNDKLKSRWGLSSGNLEEVADGVAGTRSPFVTELLAALEEYKRDAFPISELINVVKFRVKNLNRQTPIGKPLAVDGNEGGEYILYKK